MTDTPKKPDEATDESSDSALRETLSANGYVPDADGMTWGPAQPRVLVAGAYKVIRTAAAKARETLGKER